MTDEGRTWISSNKLAGSPGLETAAALARLRSCGAGPGAGDLLTVRAARALEQATMVLYDNLVSKDVLALVPAGAEMIYVGGSGLAPHAGARKHH